MNKTILTLTILIIPFLVASSVQAATASLYLSPPSGTYAVGGTFPVTVKVNSGGQTINAAEGTLIFNTDEILVDSISKDSSIFPLWVQEPTFSNSSGNIVFGGGMPNSFVGVSGTVITIIFKAKALASAQISFSSGSILAADGKGTNILNSMNGGAYTLKSKIITPSAGEVPSEEEYTPPLTVGAPPAAPVVSSPTHPDSDKYYSNNNPEFFWKLPVDATGVSLLLHPNPTADPGPISDGLIESKKFEGMEGGVWYFHIKFENQYGWSQITHRKVSIALEKPVITDFAQSAEAGNTLTIKGTSKYPGAIATVFIKKEGEELTAKDVTTDNKGNWLVVYDKSLEKGAYQVWAEITDSQGAKSNPTEKITLAVTLPPLLELTKKAADYLTVMITLIALIAALIFVVLYAWRRILLWQKRIKTETKEAEKSVQSAFKILREEIREQIEYFDKKPGLTSQEKQIRDKLQKALNVSEELISKEIKDIGKELK